MAEVVKRFSEPDQRVEQAGIREELLEFGELAVGRITHEPGWRWSTHIKPLVGTERCQARHIGLVISGRLAFELLDGTIGEAGPDSVYDIAPGHDGWVVGDEPAVVVEWTGVREWLIPAHGERVLATLLFTDIVDSTVHADGLGDHAWRRLLAAHDEAIRELLAQAHGREVATTGDGFLALFDGPARAIGTALAIRARVRALGLELRQAVHVGEVEAAGGQVRGIAVHEAARFMAAAMPGEILTSAITRTLAAGSGFTFESRGAVPLKGLRESYELFGIADG
jgi:class 3 adenylate cyclase